MLKALLILRSFLYPLIEGASPKSSKFKYYLWKKFWEFFWWLEWRLELLELGEKGPPVVGSERAILIEQLIIGLKNPKILEVGVGFGQNLVILCSLLPQENLSCIDVNPERVKAVKEFLTQHNLGKVLVEEADAQNLPYADKTFDVVFSSAMFLYLTLDQAKKALAEMLRVSRNRVVLLEQHVSGLEDQQFAGGVTEGFYYLRDYRMLVEGVGGDIHIQEIHIPNPRWGVENWKESARVLALDLS